MRFRDYGFLLATLSVVTAKVPVQAVTPPDQRLVSFCSTVRDEYLSTVRKRYESQSYEGAGSAGANISFRNGLGFRGDGSYDWDRTWDNLDQTKKQEYSSKNCDEVLKQWGAVSIEEIRADAEKAIARMRQESDKYSEDTKRIIAGFNLEAININATTRVRIEELQQAGRIEEAKILADALQRKIEVQEKGMTDRVRIETDALIAMNKADNAVELRKAELSAAVASRQSLHTLIRGGLEGLVTYFGSRADVEKEKIRADVRIREIEAQIKIAEMQARNSDPNLTLIQSWGLTTTTCQGPVVTIVMDGKQYCTQVTGWLNTGVYTYIRAEDRLESASQSPNPIAPVITPNPQPLPNDGL